MTELVKEAYGPEGDAARHLPFAEIEMRWRALPPAPKDSGRLALIVCRRADGVRETPESACLSLEDGVVGDGWSRRPPRDPEAQLAVIRRDVAEIIANGQSLPMFGDNLYVDLDVSAENLPLGTRLRVGQAVVEVTPKPHNGCVKFQGRFGNDALRFVQAKPTRDQNFRGIYWKVVEPGNVRVGDRIDVLAPHAGPRLRASPDRGAAMTLRELDPLRDRDAIRRCFAELQDFERSIDPRIPAGDEIADAYLVRMFRRCAEFDGVVLLADEGGDTVGFVTVLTRYRSFEPDDDPSEHGFVSDLVVLQPYRGRGIGRALLRAAEDRAREAGARLLRLSVKAGNDGARALYDREGFRECEVILEKPLLCPDGGEECERAERDR